MTNGMNAARKRLLVCLVLAVVLSLMAMGTLAYFSAEEVAHNVITTSGVTITLDEYQSLDGERLPYPEGPVPVMPGSTVSKVAVVKNYAAEVWARVRLDVTITAEDGTAMDTDVVSLLHPEDSGWILGEDGWWYYTEALGAGEESAPVMESVTFDAQDMDNEYQNCTVVIDVVAQAVQTANNGATVWEAAGWPSET